MLGENRAAWTHHTRHSFDRRVSFSHTGAIRARF